MLVLPMLSIDADFEQVHLLPPCIEDWVTDAHPARFIRAFVDQLDLQALGVSVRDVLAPGRPSYAPALLLRVWLYGYFKKVRSSRKVERSCQEDIGFIWLCGNQAPDHNTLWRFWNANQQLLGNIFKQSILTSCRMGLVGLTRQALDGTKLQSACHAGKAYDAKDLAKRIDQLDDDINKLQADIAQAESKGSEPSPDLPKKLKGKQKLKAAMKEAQEILVASGIKHIHPLETEARRVKTKGGKPFGYNGQVVVDEDNQIIVAADAVNEPNDSQQLTPMLDQARENVRPYREERVIEGEECPQPKSLADAGYPTAKQIGAAEAHGHEVLMPENPSSAKGETKPYHVSKFEYDPDRNVVKCPAGKELPFQRDRIKDGIPVKVYRSAEVCKKCPAFGTCTRDRHGRTIDITHWHEAVIRHREKMSKEENKEELKKRAGIVEPVFGQIKSNGEFWRWSFKGLEKVKRQWKMLCTAWNLQVMYKQWAAAQRSKGETYA